MNYIKLPKAKSLGLTGRFLYLQVGRRHGGTRLHDPHRRQLSPSMCCPPHHVLPLLGCWTSYRSITPQTPPSRSLTQVKLEPPTLFQLHLELALTDGNTARVSVGNIVKEAGAPAKVGVRTLRQRACCRLH